MNGFSCALRLAMPMQGSVNMAICVEDGGGDSPVISC
jgi:hypothetical protein